MAPPRSLVRAVRVLGRVGMKVVVSMSACPLNRVALNREGTAVSCYVFNPLWHHETLVRYKPMVSEGNAYAPREEVHDHAEDEGAGTEGGWGEEQTDVHGCHQTKHRDVSQLKLPIEEVVPLDCHRYVGKPKPIAALFLLLRLLRRFRYLLVHSQRPCGHHGVVELAVRRQWVRVGNGRLLFHWSSWLFLHAHHILNRDGPHGSR
mmetsp:Transcript_13234/g.25171  ORF Transcript_13234/g.25171 Transcript_13234/m.25171 type:complete len:205 (-) Transcript_13234:279-893(-)